MKNFTEFEQLHNTKHPLLINNIWDAASAKIAQENGAKALATSSAALAWSLGYADGSSIPIAQMLDAIKRIRKVTALPLSIDIEEGYSNSPSDVADLTEELKNMGIIGINIEDGEGSPELLVAKIKAIRHKVGKAFFINARTDVYLRTLATGQVAFNSTLERLKRYQLAGANGAFIPGLIDKRLAKKFADKLTLPINLMVDNLHTDITDFSMCNIARFSVGPSSFLNSYAHLIEESAGLTYDQMNQFFAELNPSNH